MMPSLDTAMSRLDNGDAYSWTNDPDFTYNNNNADNNTLESSRTETSSPLSSRDEAKESLTEQLIKLSKRTMTATRELECAVNTVPLMVNSPVVNEAFEAANALVRIINSIPLANSTLASSQSLSRFDGARQLPTEHDPTFLVFASHQHVLALFRAIHDSIKKSLVPMVQGRELQDRVLHGAWSTSAQFIMVLQLIMHLLGRVRRSLRMEKQKDDDQHELISVPQSDEQGTDIHGIVDSAQLMLRTLPDEHVKLGEAMQELQACIEEGIQI